MSWDMHTAVSFKKRTAFERIGDWWHKMTLIEWMIVLAIIGILAAAVAPAISGDTPRQRQERAQQLPAGCKVVEQDHINKRTGWLCPDGVKHWKRMK